MSQVHCFSCGSWIHHLDGMLIALCPACDKEAHGDDALMENALAPRKVVQIAVGADSRCLIALADDGSMWDRDYTTGDWRAVKALPQGPVAGGGE